jgi:NAD(P)-dependent dehydrogenase (short-subunit alcohol dehydrogenase family)
MTVGLVTGGASGIGLETGLTFADLGAHVAILVRDAAGTNAAVARIEAAGRRAVGVIGTSRWKATLPARSRWPKTSSAMRAPPLPAPACWRLRPGRPHGHGDVRDS